MIWLPDFGARFKNKKEKFILTISWVILTISVLSVFIIPLLKLLSINIPTIISEFGVVTGISISLLHGIFYKSIMTFGGWSKMYVWRGQEVRGLSLISIILLIFILILIRR